MLQEFKKHIKTNFPQLLAQKFLLACSGGIDSMVLVDLCVRSELDFAVAHCNFRLRGEASEGDEAFVRETAIKLNISYYVTHFDTVGYMNKNKVSLLMAARELRYTWFAEIMAANGIGRLVTAHHADDDLETFLINLSRGTGINGLLGIPERTSNISRPLLKFSRNEISRYAEAQGVPWREDRTNAETKYLRNNIRHRILPLLKELNPNFLDHFKDTQFFLGQTAEIARNQIEQVREALFSTEDGLIKIPISDLLTLNPLEAYLYALFKDFGFSEWGEIKNLLTAMSGKEVRSATYRLLKDRDALLLKPLKPEDSGRYLIQEHQLAISEPIALTIQPVAQMTDFGKNILYIDKKALKYPLVLRKWKKGDYFYPLGLHGKKKLSKFFKDEKIDVFSKENQWLLCSDNSIVWVVGRRADDRFKVTEKTSQILKFELN